ncbi:hypothetical protein [Neobacillus sp. NPDC093127]|uniref:hypothetical protein n=1 Tax=Neobacillus sp. NPDC093127 TaxID=3364296 RepID=UPI0037F52723
MAFKLNDGVVFTADRKRSDITPSGENKGTFISTKKVHHVHPHMVIATAGLGSLGQATVDLLTSIIGINESITVPEALQVVKDAFHFNHNMFKKANPTVPYLNLVAIIGGYDIDQNESYLYTLSSDDGFTLTKQEGNYLSIGPGKEIIDKEVKEKIPFCKDYEDIIKTFSAAIRKVDSVDVSKDTFSICSFYQDGYKTGSYEINENGEIIK